MEKPVFRRYTDLGGTESTNTALKEKIYASFEPVFDVFYADHQTGGRGRLGRSFYSPSGGAYFSAAYPITGTEKNIPFFTLLAGAALARSIKELTGAETLIKWPNDLYLNGKKLAGILSELISANGKPHIVFGAGVNITAVDFPEELQNKMTSFAAEGFFCPDKDRLTRRTVSLLDGFVYEKDYMNSPAAEILAELNERSLLFGKTVIYNGTTGTAGSINPDGSINIAFDGAEQKIFGGAVLMKNEE